MKKRFLLLIFCFFYACISFAQEGIKDRKQLKLNLPFGIRAGGFYTKSLAPVFILETKRKNRHEFELSRFGFSSRSDLKRDSYGREYLVQRADHGIGLRYQYSFSFMPEARFSPFLGASLQSSWTYYSFATDRLPFFGYHHHNNRNIAALVPGFRWRINERIGIDYGLDLNILEHNFQLTRIRSLALGNYYFGTYSLRSDPFRALRSRIGVFIKL